MKKQLAKIALSILLVTGMTGCDDWLTMKPENDIVLDDFWDTKADVESVLASCYRSMTEPGCIERMIVWGELRSDNMVVGRAFPGGHDMYKILIGNLKSDNAYASWSPFYTVINICNTLLHYAPQVVEQDENFTSKELELLEGEVITLRALAYFYLVRAFRDVPYVDKASIDDSQNYSPAKNSEAELLDLLINDLELIKKNNNIRAGYGNATYNKGRITRNSMLSLLADIYLWKGDYAKCIENCNLVIASSDLKLVADSELAYSQIFYRGNSSESIFELQFSDKDMINGIVQELYGKAGEITGLLSFPSALAYTKMATTTYTGSHSPFNYKLPDQTYEGVDDVRARYSYANFNGYIFSIFKYPGANVIENTITQNLSYSYRMNTPNWIVYRLSDIMLMKAEALVQLNENEEANYAVALELVNTVYRRSNPKSTLLVISNYPTKKDMEKLVLRERQRELLFEGKRWFDLARLARRENSVLSVNQYITEKMDESASIGLASMDALYMPIAKGELEANKNLKQNPFYEEHSSSQR